jgi:predicted cupin superfamily sugar epimerase
MNRDEWPDGSGEGASRRAAELIRTLELEAHPEGGHYRERFRSPQQVQASGGRHRSALTTIYFLLRAGELSRWHVVASDEAWHFYEGDPLELITFDPDREALTRTVLASPGETGEPVHVVPAGHWQAARTLGGYSLSGCTVGPGFDFQDFAFVSDVLGHEAAFESTLGAYRDLL